MEWKENKAEVFLREYAGKKRNERVEVRLHTSGRGLDVGVKRFVGYAVAAAVVLGMFVLLNSEPTVYGYVNERPITSKEEAVECSRMMFEDLAVGMAPAEEFLENMFSL